MTTRTGVIAARIVLTAVLAVGLLLATTDLFTLFFYASYAALGGLLAWRRPREVIGWLLVVIAFGFIGTTATPGDVNALEAGTASAADTLAVWVGGWVGYLTFGGFVALMVLFPSGRLPNGRWHWPAAALIAGPAVVGVLAATMPTLSFNPDGGVTSIYIANPFAVLPDLPLWMAIPPDSLILPVVVCLAIGVVGMLIRYRRAQGVQRLQLRWLVAALLFMVVAVVGGLSTLFVFGEDVGGTAWLGAIVAYPTIPLAIYIAVTRYRLYEIDRIVSRTIGWAIVTGILVAVFAGIVVGLQALLAPLTENDTLAVAGSTLVVFALFQPLRQRVQGAVDRRFNRARYNSELMAATFAERLRDQIDLAALTIELRGVTSAAVRPTGAAVWLRNARSPLDTEIP